MNYRKWFKNCIILSIIILLLCGMLTVVVDPFFHFHKPYFKYRLLEPRYTNDGISRHFDFDGIIIGTSMSQNFKTSEFDSYFGTNSVKLPYEGAGYKELSISLRTALERNPDVKKVLWVVDYNGLLRDADWSQYNDYPTYMYDDNPFNDIPYLFNKFVLLHGTLPNIARTILGQESMTMDEYSSWDVPTGASVLYMGRRAKSFDGIKEYTKEDEAEVIRTFEENFLSVIRDYKDVEFYLYFTPYSIYNWEALMADGNVERTIDAQETATELLLSCDNVKLYSFFEYTDIICNLDYYRDEAHYDSRVSSMILDFISRDEGLLTWDNYKDRIAWQKEFYENFDYDGYFAWME